MSTNTTTTIRTAIAAFALAAAYHADAYRAAVAVVRPAADAVRAAALAAAYHAAAVRAAADAYHADAYRAAADAAAATEEPKQ